MINFMSRKLNKKGFTLAELLIVVAIIAILVAIAVPIFTSSLREAQLRTNEANARSIKSAGVTYILAHWSDRGMSAGTEHGWIVTADVDTHGEITNLKVEILTKAAPTNPDDRARVQLGTQASPKGSSLPVSKSGNYAPEYLIWVYLTDADLTA